MTVTRGEVCRILWFAVVAFGFQRWLSSEPDYALSLLGLAITYWVDVALRRWAP